MATSKNVVRALQDIGDMAIDALEKSSTPASRAGLTVERVGKLLEDGVDPGVVALQLTKNSSTKHPYSEEFVKELGHLRRDCKSRVLITKKQTRGLGRDQHTYGEQRDEGDGMDFQLA